MGATHCPALYQMDGVWLFPGGIPRAGAALDHLRLDLFSVARALVERAVRLRRAVAEFPSTALLLEFKVRGGGA